MAADARERPRRPELVPSGTGFGTLSMGYQTIAPGGRVSALIRDGTQVELADLLPWPGKRRRRREESTPSSRERRASSGPDVKHEIVNESDADLVMMWVISPAGLENFFALGRPVKGSGVNPPPTPFERPTDVVAIERELGMNDTTAS